MTNSTTLSPHRLLEGKIVAKLRFEKSERDPNTYIGFISQDCITGQIFGRSQDSRFPKKIVILDHKLNYMVEPGMLYRTTMTPMKSGKGYVATAIEPHQFSASVSIDYRPKINYRVIVTIGKSEVFFDPKDGATPATNTIKGAIEALCRRIDVRNINAVVHEFEMACKTMVDFYEKDGFFYNRLADVV